MATRPILVPYQELASVIGFSWTRQHLANLIKQGRFPKPVKLSAQRIAWRYADLIAWIDELSDAPLWKKRHPKKRVLLERSRK